MLITIVLITNKGKLKNIEV